MKRRGFTLAELMIGLGIMAMIIGMAVPTVKSTVQKSRENALRQTLYTVRQAVARAREDTGSYTLTLNDLTQRTAPVNVFSDLGVSVVNPQPTRWRGPYLTQIPVDPVSNTAFNYSVNSNGMFSVTSSATGSDGGGTSFSSY